MSVPKQRNLRPSQNHHPYMKMVYHDIDEKRNHQWSDKEVDTITGIEPNSGKYKLMSALLHLPWKRTNERMMETTKPAAA